MSTKAKADLRPSRATHIKCPICKGKGKVPAPGSYRQGKFQHIDAVTVAKLLRKAGYSLREIGAYLGYPSPRSVQLLLKKSNLK